MEHCGTHLRRSLAREPVRVREGVEDWSRVRGDARSYRRRGTTAQGRPRPAIEASGCRGVCSLSLSLSLSLALSRSLSLSLSLSLSHTHTHTHTHTGNSKTFRLKNDTLKDVDLGWYGAHGLSASGTLCVPMCIYISYLYVYFFRYPEYRSTYISYSNVCTYISSVYVYYPFCTYVSYF